MKRALLLVACAACSVDHTGLEGHDHDDLYYPAAQTYTKAEADDAIASALAARLGVPDCAPGEVVTRAATGWVCTAIPARLAALAAALCPRGFTAGADGAATVCARTVAGLGDELVRVGNFWIDRYEASVCPGSGDLGGADGHTTTASACSVAGATAAANITWFQAAALCANAGKRLCSNAEWQVAAIATPDPGAYPDPAWPSCAAAPSTDGCTTCAAGPGPTGAALGCSNRFGARDMVGNLAEWVSDWRVAGRMYQTTDGQVASGSTGWPAGYGGDETRGVNGSARTSGWQNGVPAAMVRGGSYNGGTGAGVYDLDLSKAPTFADPTLGARCCMGGR